MQKRSGGHTSSFRPREVGVHCLCATPCGPVVRFRCLVLARSGDLKAHMGCGVGCHGNCWVWSGWARAKLGESHDAPDGPPPLSATPPNQYPLPQIATKLEDKLEVGRSMYSYCVHWLPRLVWLLEHRRYGACDVPKAYVIVQLSCMCI